jgi:hypothetical protein
MVLFRQRDVKGRLEPHGGSSFPWWKQSEGNFSQLAFGSLPTTQEWRSRRSEERVLMTQSGLRKTSQVGDPRSPRKGVAKNGSIGTPGMQSQRAIHRGDFRIFRNSVRKGQVR